MYDVDVLCFGITWDQLGAHQELLRSCAAEHRLFFIEEPVHAASRPFVTLRALRQDLCIVTPHVRAESSKRDQNLQLRGQLTMLALEHRIVRPVLWYLHPERAPALRGLPRSSLIYGPLSPEQRTSARSLEHQALVEEADLFVPEPFDSSEPAALTWSRMRQVVHAILLGRARRAAISA